MELALGKRETELIGLLDLAPVGSILFLSHLATRIQEAVKQAGYREVENVEACLHGHLDSERVLRWVLAILVLFIDCARDHCRCTLARGWELDGVCCSCDHHSEAVFVEFQVEILHEGLLGLVG